MAIDRVSGILTSVAIKAPVRVATTGPIALAGHQTVTAWCWLTATACWSRIRPTRNRTVFTVPARATGSAAATSMGRGRQRRCGVRPSRGGNPSWSNAAPATAARSRLFITRATPMPPCTCRADGRWLTIPSRSSAYACSGRTALARSMRAGALGFTGWSCCDRATAIRARRRVRGSGGAAARHGAGLGRLTMTDPRRDRVHTVARAAVHAWIERGDDRAGRALRDVLHALSAIAGQSERKLGKRKGRPRRRATPDHSRHG